MAGFEELRNELSRWREQSEANRARLLLAREAAGRGRRAAVQQIAGLEREARTMAERGVDLWNRFTAFTDPRQGIQQLQDRYPILLFPLRLETRFKTGPEGRPQLWVRVYPDECLVDAFEPSLAEGEVASAQAFWAEIWRAGGVEAEELAAWRDLATSHGAGRAGWIVKHYAPLNPGDQPEKTAATDILLIIPATTPVPAEAAEFWRDVWRDGGTDAAIAARRPALEAAAGAAVAAQIIERFRPVNLGDPPVSPQTRASTTVTVTAVQFTPVEDLEVRRQSWSQAPRVSLLPEQLVLIAYIGGAVHHEVVGEPIPTPLVAGPDPNAPEDQQFRPEGDDLRIPDAIRWMFDFETALKVGMAFRFDVTVDEAQVGFDRIVVLGVRLADAAGEGQKNLEALLEHHLASRTGLELLPQGTATNNTETGSTGYAAHGDPSSGFTAFFKDQPLYATEADPLLRRDGQWFAEALGVNDELVQHIPNANGRDQLEARAMHLALWPGTLGYMMRTMLAPVFAEDDIEATRHFFTRYVSGRGGIPALRVGAQPYGILPVAAFDRITWLDKALAHRELAPTTDLAFLRRLVPILKRIEHDWDALGGQVSFVGKTGVDPHQVLLDVLGLHASSVEFYPLKADSADHQFNVLALLSFPVATRFLAELVSKPQAMALLRSFGYDGSVEPPVLNLLFSTRQPRLDGPVIDTPPLSETAPIGPCAGSMNYVEWMLNAVRTNIDILQEESGFDPDKQPRALLYLMLRHALLVAFHLTGVREKVRRGLLRPSLAHYAEPPFVHVAAAATASESRYSVLHERLAAAGNIRIADEISRTAGVIDADLAEHIAALDRLARAPTAALERVFAEHIDCVSYRLDAWKQGVLAWQLEQMRAATQGEAGTYVGAYGWLEPVRPKPKSLTPVQLPREIEARVNRPGEAPLMRDAANLGLVHAPSLNQATTAAVLRNGYQANEGRLAVDLSSRRVRLALGVLEGMRNGQSLGALLGYQFERHLHDADTLSLRALVFGIRRQFPLVANQITTTKDDTLAIEAIAAMNVVDGLKLVRHVEASPVTTYPWGVSGLPPTTDPTQGPAIDAAATHIRDVNDAVADLVLAEGVHQAVQGNFDRSAGTLDAFAKGGYPPEVDVVRTPRTGTALTLRTAIHFDPDAPANPVPPIPLTPLATAEPALNAWLAPRLPAPTGVGCSVTFVDRTTNTPQTLFVEQQDLELQPIDLVYQLQTAVDPSLRFLDERVLQFIHTTQPVRIDAPVQIEYTRRVTGRVTFFELQALIGSLHALTVSSRPLQPADLARQTDARAAEQPPSTVDLTTLTGVRDDLHIARRTALNALIAALAGGTIDAAIAAYTAEVSRLALFRLPQTGTGFAYEWRTQAYEALSRKLQAVIDRWTARLNDADARLADLDANPGSPDAEQRATLATVELLVSTSYLSPPPVLTAAYRAAVGGKRNAFETELNALRGIAGVGFATLDAFLQAVKARALDPFELDALTTEADDAEAARFRQQLVDTATGLRDEIVKRIAAADSLLATVPVAIDQVQSAAKLLLGDDFQLIPRFTLPGPVAADVALAWQQSNAGNLTRHLVEVVGRDFPVDDWLHGVARVRDKMRHWENAILLAEAFGTNPPVPTPIQLPFQANDAWLALEIPPPAVPGAPAIERDRLLYTAHFAAAFDQAKPISGLLVDEWSEVIPEGTETTGVTFHYDRPNSEPPQCWLLALPAAMDGAWTWEELREAVTGTLDAARRRAIEPDHIAGTNYSWLVPATYAAYTFPEISISNYLMRNVDVFARVKE